MRIVRSGPSVALLVGIGVAALAARPAAAARFSRLSVDDGLSTSSVENIVQDRYGFLWFGTQEGLDRFDGQRFEAYGESAGQPGFLLDHEVAALALDRRGDLWVGTPAGLQRLDPETGRLDEPLEASRSGVRIGGVVATPDGGVWFTVAAGGLWVFSVGDAAVPTPRPVAVELLGERATIDALAVAGRTSVWAASAGRLVEVDLEGGAPRSTLAANGLGEVETLAADGRGGVWIGRRRGPLLRWRNERNEGSAGGRIVVEPRIEGHVLALRRTADGALWIGRRAAGLSRLDPETGALVTYRHDPGDGASLSEDDVASLFEDRAGALWIGTWNGGVNRLDPREQAFASLVHRPWEPRSLPDDDVVSMVEAPDGRLWTLSRNGVLAVGAVDVAESARDAGGGFDVVPLDARLARPRQLAWACDRLFVASDAGLLSVDPRAFAAREESVPGLAPVDRRSVAAIVGDGRVVWAVAGGALHRLECRRAGGGFEGGRADLPFADPVSRLARGAGGRVWIGSASGEVAVAETAPDGRPAVRAVPVLNAGGARAERGFVSALWEDGDDGVLWIGTRRGLGRLDLARGRVTWLDDPSRLPSRAIAGVAVGADGFVWVSSNRGLTRLDRRGLMAVQFGSAEGAQGAGYASGAAAAGASGRLYFAGHGVTVFDPRRVAIDARPPGVVFTVLEVLHREVAPRWLDPTSPLERGLHATEAVTLPASATVFSIEMATLQFGDPSSVRVAHRLDGFDHDWIETEAGRRVATYTRLAAGSYVLRARARAKNGVWSPAEARLAIRILPPWWRTRGALSAGAALALLALGATVAGVRRRGRIRVALAERDALRNASVTDPLTGLHNRRFLAAHLEHEVPKLLRDYRAGAGVSGDRGPDLLFLLLDIDHFKAINDRYGHAEGDRALVRLSARLREQIRDEDLAVRWGGDELLIVARSFDRERAPAAAERLRRAAAEIDAPEGGRPLALTVSLGWAAFPFLPHDPGALGWEQTLRLADRALLATKRRRRDGWTGFTATPATTAAELNAFLEEAAAEPPASLGRRTSEP